MSQINSGFRKILSYPKIYSAFQYIMGADKFWINFISNEIKPKAGYCILDIGCGPADILKYLPNNISYWGFDISKEYINSAKEKFGERATFICKQIDLSDLDNMPKFDRVILTGVFHHLDDKSCKEITKLAYLALKKGGKLISVDPCFTSKQNFIARFLITKDRGQNVKFNDKYKHIIDKRFRKISTKIINKSWIPYTHCFIVCTK